GWTRSSTRPRRARATSRRRRARCRRRSPDEAHAARRRAPATLRAWTGGWANGALVARPGAPADGDGVAGRRPGADGTSHRRFVALLPGRAARDLRPGRHGGRGDPRGVRGAVPGVGAPEPRRGGPVPRGEGPLRGAGARRA